MGWFSNDERKTTANPESQLISAEILISIDKCVALPQFYFKYRLFISSDVF
jgi:hypothetical protein